MSTETKLSWLVNRIHNSLYHPEFAKKNPQVWHWATMLVMFANSESWYENKRCSIEFAKKQFEFWGLSEAEIDKNIDELLAPKPPKRVLRLLYMAVDRFIRLGQSPGTIQKYISLGDIYPTQQGGRGWSHGDRWLATSVLKGIKKAYVNPRAQVIPLSTAMSFWLFLGILRKWQNSEWVQLFWLASQVIRVGMFRSTEVLYDGKIGRLLTLGDIEFDDKSLFEIATGSGGIVAALDTLRENLKSVGYWSVFLEFAKSDQVGKGVKVFLTPGNETFPILLTLLNNLHDRARAAEERGTTLRREDPFLATAEEETMNYKRFQTLWDILTEEFNTPFTKLSIYSLRKGPASDLLRSGRPLPQIRILGRWSNGTQDYYFRLEPEEIVKIQNESLVVGPPGWKSHPNEKVLREVNKLETQESSSVEVWKKSGWASRDKGSEEQNPSNTSSEVCG